MEESTSREKILKKVRAALINQSKSDPADVDFDSAIFHEAEETPELIFAQQFSDLNGQFVFCENENDFRDNMLALVQENNFESIFCTDSRLQRMLKDAGVNFSSDMDKINEVNVGVTGCEYLIARTGSVLVSSKQASGRRLVVYPNYHIVVAWTSQLVFNIRDALKGMKQRYGEQPPSSITLISGPSRTADIEKTLVQGAHGPKEIFVFLVDDTPI
ncbi:MAG: hypothetical protein FD123_904 [Bacteroidetes bacterium]|nr:MAG: hypothetical protein FD123_904 [Bacteroidota bacterium]